MSVSISKFDTQFITMRISFFLVLLIIIFSSCKKDKFTTAPQISFREFKPNVWVAGNLDPNAGPVLSLKLTDSEGDFDDSAFVYVRNLTTSPLQLDSFKFPDLSGVVGKNLDADIEVTLNNLVNSGTAVPPYTDTLFFEIYVMDIAKHKSNVITTTEPLYLLTE